jgi:raffinose/stachyose/melibiose transport system substrate-binding protein
MKRRTNKMKKPTLLSMLMLIALVVTACGAPAATEAPVATEPAAAEPVTLSLLGAQNENDALMIEALTEAYTALHPNVTFEIEVAAGGGSEVDNLVKTRLATGEMNDIFYYNSGSLLQALHPSDVLVDLSQEPGDPVHARRAGHPLDRQRDLGHGQYRRFV